MTTIHATAVSEEELITEMIALFKTLKSALLLSEAQLSLKNSLRQALREKAFDTSEQYHTLEQQQQFDIVEYFHAFESDTLSIRRVEDAGAEVTHVANDFALHAEEVAFTVHASVDDAVTAATFAAFQGRPS